MADFRLEDIVSLMKRRGFAFPSSEIYGGWEAAYDFGPLGVELLRNLRNSWWTFFVHKQPNIVSLDGAIISHPHVWEASGHVESFSDVMVEDTMTHKRYRADHLLEEAGVHADGMTPEEIDAQIQEHDLKSPDGNILSKARTFKLLVEVSVGTLENEKEIAYLRGETCQPMFYNFKLVKDTMRLKLPFGIAQIGKAFRNEIKVGPFIFRTREFEQMELEMFCKPEDVDEWFGKLKDMSRAWLSTLKVTDDKLRFRDQDFKERAHYNKVATDLEYEFPFGWKEFQGIHNRGDWDLRRHQEYSGEDFTCTDPVTGETCLPHVAEYSIGLNRLMLVLVCDAYHQDDQRTWLALSPSIAPYKAAVFPLLRNKPELVEKAQQIYNALVSEGMHVDWDDRGNIGKRYLAQDEIGTPFCLTVDFQTLEDSTLTIRDRDTTEQTRIAESKISSYIKDRIKIF